VNLEFYSINGKKDPQFFFNMYKNAGAAFLIENGVAFEIGSSKTG
jgi:hypothetical protein